MLEKDKICSYITRLLSRTQGVDAFKFGEAFYYNELIEDAQRPSVVKAKLTGLASGIISYVFPSTWEEIANNEVRLGYSAIDFDIASNLSMVFGAVTASVYFNSSCFGVGTYLVSRSLINLIRPFILRQDIQQIRYTTFDNHQK